MDNKHQKNRCAILTSERISTELDTAHRENLQATIERKNKMLEIVIAERDAWKAVAEALGGGKLESVEDAIGWLDGYNAASKYIDGLGLEGGE